MAGEASIHAARKGAYEIAYDGERRLMELTLRGFWSAEDLDAFSEDLMRCARAAKQRDGDFLLLSDSRQFEVQSVDVTEGFQRAMATRLRSDEAFSAIVVASTLNKLQAERAVKATGTRFFTDIDEARDWLLSAGG